MRERVIEQIRDNIELKRKVLADEVMLKTIQLIAMACVQCFRSGGKVLLCGNGGSAADAQHIAAELSGRFRMERPALYAESLTVNTSSLTAISNDYGFEQVFARQVEAMGAKGDILVALSTSGNSANVVNALKQAQQKGMTCIGLTGADGGQFSAVCELLIKVPSTDTARIQETHILIGHLVCSLVEHEMFSK
ncbi:MAG: D-sedoheptulose 7-phosphate isomerase [Saprospiraceae bacterium]|nr:D-sedoheptulose 7-phosphate isomerase [Saprospiraceae bacterium]